MTVITHMQRRSRLAQIIDQPGGVSVGAALAQAERNLSALKDQALEVIRTNVADLVSGPPAEAPEAVRLDSTYATAAQIIDAASPFAMDDLCIAARGLCDLVDAAPREGGFDWRIPAAYAQAMKLLLALPADAGEARQTIVDNLNEVLRRKLGDQPGA